MTVPGEEPVGDDMLHGYVDGFLDEVGRARVEQLLAADPATAARVRDWQRDRAALRLLLQPGGPDPVPPSLSPPLLLRRQPRRRAARWPVYAVAASLLLAFVAGGAVGWWQRDGADRRGLDELIRQAALAQNVFAFDPRSLVPPAVTDAIPVGLDRSNPGHPVAAPDLSAFGYTLLGSTMVPTPQGSAAFYLYQKPGGGRLGIMVRLMSGVNTDAALRPVTVGAATFYAWSHGGVGFGLVADRPTDGLGALAASLQTHRPPF